MSSTQVAKLAQTLAMMQSPDPSAQVVQGVIVSWQQNSTPPSVTVTLAGDTQNIPGIQYLESYTPNTGDVVQILKQQGSYLVIGAIAVNASVTIPTVSGPGTTNQCVSSGGVNRTTQPMFWYVDSGVVSVGAGSGWSYTSSGATINGCGMVHATPGDNADSLAFLSVIQSNTTISGGSLTVGGAAFQVNPDGTVTGCSSANIRVNISALCW